MAASSVLGSVSTILERLHKTYPNARYELNWDNPLQLLVATILAAQCTDERVNQVTAALFKKYRTAKDWADVDRRTWKKRSDRQDSFGKKRRQSRIARRLSSRNIAVAFRTTLRIC